MYLQEIEREYYDENVSMYGICTLANSRYFFDLLIRVCPSRERYALSCTFDKKSAHIHLY